MAIWSKFRMETTIIGKTHPTLYAFYWKYEISEFKDRVKMIEGCISGSIHFVMMVNEDEGPDRRTCAAYSAMDYES